MSQNNTLVPESSDGPTTLRLQSEVRKWRDLAGYLASCHAATLENLPKRAAKHERERMVNLCLKCVPWLRGFSNPRPIYSDGNAELIERDIKRCEEAAKNHAT